MDAKMKVFIGLQIVMFLTTAVVLYTINEIDERNSKKKSKTILVWEEVGLDE